MSLFNGLSYHTTHPSSCCFISRKIMNLFNLIFSILSIYSSTLVEYVRTEEILGCGGFIKSHAEIDFSKVEVKLLTKQGSLRDQTDCSPGNGYYFLPIYDKGDYILKISPPPGWSFEPEQIEISFDGETDICSLGKDVNFSFKGFGITGKVEISGRDGGAKGVNVELKSENNEDVRTTISDANGIFYFTPVIPGKFTIKVKRDTWHFEEAERTVIVNTGNTELPSKSFVVSGFDVRGKFLLDPQSNIDIQIVIFRKTGSNSVVKCDAANLPQISSNNENYSTKPVCVTTVVNGVYSFSGLGSGQYLVKPYFQRKIVDLFIKPEAIEIDVVKDSLVISESFEITGFSASGRVLSAANSFGVGNAKIKLNGKEVATTHTDGTYVIANIKAGTYTIQVEADKLQFNDQTVKVSTANPIIPDITVSAFQVCGLVVSQQSHTVALTKHSSTFHTQIKSAPETGEWCVFLPNGRFSAEILSTSDDRIQFFPIQQIIEVSSSPVSGIIFSQLRATVTGSVECLPDSGSNCNDISVTLNSLDSSGKYNGKQSLALLKNGKYSFTDVLPGTYEVNVPTPSSLCWESTTITLNVKSATETIPAFVHIGYKMSVISSHSTKMTYKLNAANQSDQAEEIQLVTGLNQFCVSKYGQYIINFIGCMIANVPPFMHTNDVQPANVNAIKHKNGVRLLSDVSANYKFIVERSNKVETVDLAADKQKSDGLFVYRHDFDLELDERIVITPKNDVMLFKPEKKEIFGGSDCLETAFSFYATKGMIINGKINPPISDALITLKFTNNPAMGNLETRSDQSGSFKFGPYDGSLDVELTAYKESYVFSEYDPVNQLFKAHKLCEIIAVVRDEQKNLLSGVLLSLSGAESYRKNLVTSDDGTIKYHSLSPGQYYLRAMMKEYKFEPHSKVIDVADGETINVELSGKRVAYSIFGTVTTLSGEPFPNVLVATTAKEPCEISHQEDATTEKNGNYRIRGLLPGCSYDVQVKSGSIENSNVDRTVPEEHTIKIEKVDVKDVNFVAFSPIAFVDVIARVYASNNDYYKSLRIKLYKKGNSDSPIYSQRVESPLNPKSRINPGIMVYFPRIPFDGNTYFVELTTTLSDKHFKYSLPVESFLSNRSSVFIEMDFAPEVRTSENELNQNSLSALLLVGLIAIVFFKQDLAMELMNFVWSRLSGVIDNALSKSKKKENRHDAVFDENEIEKLAQSINATKKKSVRKA